jgi:hypothetical protein
MSEGFSWIVNSDFALKQFIEFVTEHYQKHRHVTFTWQVGRQRSKKQNAALHVWLRELSKQLNEAGYDMKKTLKPEVEIPWDDEGIMAKEHLWRPVQRIMLDKESTVEPEKMEYTKVYETLNRHLSTKFGISIPWPQHEPDAGKHL